MAQDEPAPDFPDPRDERTRTVLDRWRRDPPLASFLPLKFPAGSVLQVVSTACASCGDCLDGEVLRGRCTRPRPDVAAFEGVGACRACALLTPVLFRVRGIGGGLRIEWPDPEQGWVKADLTGPTGLLNRGWRKIRQAVGATRPPATAGLRQALAAARRPCFIPGMGGDAPDPIAEGILATEWVEALDAHLAIRGVRGLRPLSGGASSVVLATGDGSLVVRLGIGACHPRPDIPEVLQALDCGELGPLRWEVLPMADTADLGEADVAAMAAALEANGFSFSDPGTDNLGRFEGRTVVLDPGAVTRLTPAPRI